MIETPPADEAVLRPGLGQVAIVSLVSVGVLFITVGASAQFFNLSWGLWFSEAFVFLAEIGRASCRERVCLAV